MTQPLHSGVCLSSPKSFRADIAADICQLYALSKLSDCMWGNLFSASGLLFPQVLLPFVQSRKRFRVAFTQARGHLVCSLWFPFPSLSWPACVQTSHRIALRPHARASNTSALLRGGCCFLQVASTHIGQVTSDDPSSSSENVARYA